MKSLLTLTAAAFVVGLLIADNGCRRQTTEPASTPAQSATAIDRVTAGKPVRKTLKLITTQPGRIEALSEEMPPLFPKLAGYVHEVLVDIGDSVKKDQLLIKLSIPEMLDEVKQMEARSSNRPKQKSARLGMPLLSRPKRWPEPQRRKSHKQKRASAARRVSTNDGRPSTAE